MLNCSARAGNQTRVQGIAVRRSLAVESNTSGSCRKARGVIHSALINRPRQRTVSLCMVTMLWTASWKL
jgi:hypothetical protein